MRNGDPLGGLAVFLAVAEHRSFTQAALALGLSRATVSAQLRELERRLAVRLLQRSTRNVALTEAGEAYRAALADLMPRIREAERVATFYQTEAAGRLRVSAPPDLGQRHLLPVVAAFLRRHPAITMDLDFSHATAKLVEQGYDLAIRGTLSVEPNLIARPLGRSPMHLCAAPDYLARHPAPRRPEDLAGHACLHFTLLRGGRAWPLQRDGLEVRAPVTPRLELNDGEGLRRAALEGLGITLLPAFLVGEDLRAGRLAPVLADWTVPPLPLNAVYPANRHIALKVRAFVTFLAERFKGNPDLDAPA